MCKVIGKIEIPDNYSSEEELICDECGNITNSSFGDVRIKSTRVYSDGTEEDRFICPDCEFELFGNLIPHSIFE
jgi:hypothetical protein